jgi:crotonobetainyl-CoA:carnitine CoA-transferase CaiB-like acyl-CoA transferase
MARWCAERSNDEALQELAKANLPAGPVLSPQQVLDHEHLRATGAFQEVDYPGLPRPAPLLKSPMSLSATPAEIRTPPPRIGEHTETVLADLGYSLDERGALRAGGIV